MLLYKITSARPKISQQVPFKLVLNNGLRSFGSEKSRRRRRFSSTSVLLANSAATTSNIIPDFLSNTILSTFTSTTKSSGDFKQERAANPNATETETVASFPATTPFPIPTTTDKNGIPRPPVEDFAAKAFSCTDAQTIKPRTRSPTKTKELSPIAPYIALTKPRLTALVVLSAMSSYALTPYDATLSQLMFLTLGTTLTSGAANAINMGREHIYDGLMTRTRSRPVVRKLITPNNAFTFAGVSGTLGVAALYFGVNPTVALLGGANIALYSGLYTTLKRRSILNTWVGAVVGAVPPLMGWAASSSLSDPGAWFLAGLLYAWQFPHFNALSYSIRDEYRRAGYIMTAWTSPALNARVALRYSIAMFPLCIGLSYFGVTDWVFALDSSVVNGWLTYQAYKFWLEHRNSPDVARHNGQLLDPNYKFSSSSGSAGSGGASNGFARKLFWGSVIHLPAILLLAMMHKKGQWDWLFGPDEEEAF